MSTPVAIIRSIGGFIFDATFEETHTTELEITDNPIETGVAVSDSAYMKPIVLTISAGVSDAPLHKLANDQFADGGGQSRSQNAYLALKKLQSDAIPFSVQTGLFLYQNMIIKRIRTSQDKDTSRVLAFETEIREALIVGTQIVTYPPRAAGTPSHQAAQTVAKGTQQGAQQADTQTQSSLLAKLFSAFGNTSTPGIAPKVAIPQ